jgi:hypothetical protein
MNIDIFLSCIPTRLARITVCLVDRDACGEKNIFFGFFFFLKEKDAFGVYITRTIALFKSCQTIQQKNVFLSRFFSQLLLWEFE